MSSSTLKIIALISMIVDHIGSILFPQYIFLRMIGRISFPIFAFLTAKSCEYTKDYKKYLIRLLIFALISEIPYDLAFNQTTPNISINFLENTNVIYTLLLGSIGIYMYKNLDETNKNKDLKLFFKIGSLIAMCFLADYFSTDYSSTGVLMIYIFYIFGNNNYQTRYSKPIMFIMVALLISTLSYNINNPLMLLANLSSLLLIYFYNGKKGLNLKWLFYIAYPLHLILLYFISGGIL